MEISKQQLEVFGRLAELVRKQCAANLNVYDAGSFAPNLRSIVDLSLMSPEMWPETLYRDLAHIEDQLNEVG